jgi:hypothetical protein
MACHSLDLVFDPNLLAMVATQTELVGLLLCPVAESQYSCSNLSF